MPALHIIEQTFNVKIAIGKGFEAEVETGQQNPNNRIWFSVYRMFMYEKFGHIGHGNKIKIPSCLRIRQK